MWDQGLSKQKIQKIKIRERKKKPVSHVDKVKKKVETW